MGAPGDIPEPLSRLGVRRHGAVEAAGWHVFEVDEIDSTNTVLAAAGDAVADRTVLAARHQTAGRGRLGRRWDAPPGANLLVSLLVRDVGDDPHQLTRALGIAAVDACRDVAAVSVQLKWPNDLVLGDAKLAGMLAERTDTGTVVGLGLNVAWAPPGAALLGRSVAVDDVLRAVLVAFGGLLADLPGADLAGRYRSRSATIGRIVRVELPDRHLVGRAVDVADDGRLVVLDDCGITHRLSVGDVVHLRPGVPPG
jgi:BirA family biotin operon repressor/biotin-[acetyl-CoA-carboxylase] ligase